MYSTRRPSFDFIYLLIFSLILVINVISRYMYLYAGATGPQGCRENGQLFASAVLFYIRVNYVCSFNLYVFYVFFFFSVFFSTLIGHSRFFYARTVFSRVRLNKFLFTFFLNTIFKIF